MIYPTLDDTAILKSDNGFCRPSDLFESSGKVNLLCANESENIFRPKYEYLPFEIKKVTNSYMMIRGTHGYLIHATVDSIFVESRGSDINKKLQDLPVARLKRKYGYIPLKINEIIEEGFEENFEINLRDYTDKKTGTYDIATEDFFRFLGWCYKTGHIRTEDALLVHTKNSSDDYYENLVSKLDLDFIKKSGKKKTTYKFRKNWLIDVVIGIVGNSKDRFIEDTILFNCGKKLARAFREGFINCCCKDNYFKHADRDRYEYTSSVEGMSDISFMWRKAGFNVTATYRYKKGTTRMEERGVPYFNYLTEVKSYANPKVMYEIRPLVSCYHSLWVSGYRFRVTLGSKDIKKLKGEK